MSYHRPQEILTFVSCKRDHAAVWTFMEMMPNEKPDWTSGAVLIQDRLGQWYLVARYLYNTDEQALESLDHGYYSDSHETVVML